MKIFLLGAAVGFMTGSAITMIYFSLVTLFGANAKFAAAQRKGTALKESEIPSPTPKEKAQGVGA
jgi:hypothetical protein